MAEASRTRKSIHNSTVALGFYALSLFIGFFSRKVFLDYLGTDILGLNTTAQNLLQFLNLADLGIGGAVGFSLYKPIRDGNETAINEIVALQGKLYRVVGLVIISGSAILMAFFPLIFEKITLPLWYAYAAFGTFLFSSVLSYFVNYKQILLSASQQDYKIQYSFRTIQLIKIVAQICAVYFLPFPYMWWLGIEVVFNALASWSLHITTVRTFPNLKKVESTFKELRKKYAEIVTKIKQTFFHRIGGFALTQTSPLIIYAYINLNEVALYGNYMVIVTGIQLMISSAFNSMTAGIGNLVAEGNEERIRKVFEELFSLRFFITAIICSGFIFFTQPIVTLWIGSEYLLPFSTLVILGIYLFIMIVRLNVDSFIAAFGLYGDIWSPVIEATLNISLSILLGKFFGLNGIIAGVCISLILVILMWKPFYLCTRAIRGFLWKYVLIFTTNLIIGIGAGVGIWFLCRQLIIEANENVTSFLINATIVTGIYSAVLLFLLAILTPGMRMALRRFHILK